MCPLIEPLYPLMTLSGSFSDPIKKCPTFTIKDISQKTKQNKPGTLPQILSVVGYIAGEKRLDYENQTTKYLLFNDYDEKSKRGISPAVMLFFYNTEVWCTVKTLAKVCLSPNQDVK